MNYITVFIIILAVSLIIKQLVKSSQKTPVNYPEGEMILKYSPIVAVIGIIAMLFGAAIALVTAFQIVPTTGNEVVPYLTLFFVLIGLPLVILQLRTKTVITSEKICFRGMFTKREIRWDRIDSISLNMFSEFVIHSDQQRLKLNMMLSGISGFINLMKKKLPAEKYIKAIEKYETVIKNMER